MERSQPEGWTHFMVSRPGQSAAAKEEVTIHTRDEIPAVQTYSICERDNTIGYAHVEAAFFTSMECCSDTDGDSESLASPVSYFLGLCPFGHPAFASICTASFFEGHDGSSAGHQSVDLALYTSWSHFVSRAFHSQRRTPVIRRSTCIVHVTCS